MLFFGLRGLAFISGLSIIAFTLLSAIRSFVLPRGTPVKLTQRVFLSVRRVMRFIISFSPDYRNRDRVMAFYAPVSLLVTPLAWLALIVLAYTLMFWAVEDISLMTAFTQSGSSLLTLGFAPITDPASTVLAFSEATLGLVLVALLIAYLPTMYSAFSKREVAVTLLSARAGTPPSAVEMFVRFHQIGGLDRLAELWESWEAWFAELEESHTSLAPVSLFRSPQPERSWVTAAGAILDSASLAASILDVPPDYQAPLCIRAGFLALRHIAEVFGVTYKSDVSWQDPISISRAQFEEACDRLAKEGIPLKADRDQGWQDFAGWRVNYDTVLIALAGITMAPSAPWLPDQWGKFQVPSIGAFSPRRLKKG